MNNPFIPHFASPPKMTSGRTALWQAMATLGYKKTYHEITVKELCKSAYIARSTFYLPYKNIDELLMENTPEILPVGKSEKGRYIRYPYTPGRTAL